MLDQEKVLKDITSKLENCAIHYMLTGCIAVNYYGRPRSTQDIDIVIELASADICKLVSELKKNYYVSIEDVEDAVRGKVMFNVIHNETNIKVDFWQIKDDNHSKLRFSRRIQVPIFGQDMWIASPEDTICVKLMWFARWKDTKHYNDALGIYQVQKEKLDMEYLKSWAERYKVEKLLTKVEREKYEIWQ